MRKLSTTGAVAMLCIAGGCATEDTVRMDGLTVGAGNAMAANTVMQMVDPWPRGVERTKLLVPADRRMQSGPADAAADSKASQASATN